MRSDRCREAVAEGGQPGGENRWHQRRTGGGSAMRRHRTRTIESRRQRKSPRSIAANTCRRRRSAHPPAGGVRREAHHAPWTPTSSPVVPLPPSDQIAESRAQAILDKGADYLLAVKDNWPTLSGEIEHYFADALDR